MGSTTQQRLFGSCAAHALRVVGLACLAALAASIVAIMIVERAAAGEAGQQVWELRPYRVQVLLGFAARPEFGGNLPSALAGRLAASIPSLQGGAWSVTVTPAPDALQQALAASLDGIPVDALPKEALDADKVILAMVAGAGGGYEVAAREFDVATGLWSPPVLRPFAQLRKLHDACLAAVFEAFAPLARLSSLKDGRVVLRLRASALKPRDAALTPTRRGSVFRLAASSTASHATVIPWTFCTVEEIAQDELRGRLETGLQEPLPERWETSLEVLALGVAPPRRPTVLTLKAVGNPAQAMPGYEVYGHHGNMVPAAGTAGLSLLGRTDRQGSLLLPPVDHVLQIALVKHGDQWLARLPIVPGLEPQLTATVDHSEHRIEVDGRVAALRDALVDLAARRRMLLGSARARLAARRFSEAEQSLKQLRELPVGQDLVAARIAEAKKDFSQDTVSLARLDAVLAEFQQVVATQFDSKEADEMAAQIEQEKGGKAPGK